MARTRFASLTFILLLIPSFADATARAAGPDDPPASAASAGLEPSLSDPWSSPRQQGRRGAIRAPGLVLKDQILPHWVDDNRRFWYRNDLAAGARKFIAVDAVKGTREAAFDHKRLAAAVAKARHTGCLGRQAPVRLDRTRRPREIRAFQGGRHRLEVRPHHLRVLEGPGR